MEIIILLTLVVSTLAFDDGSCPPGSFVNGSICELCPLGTIQPMWDNNTEPALCKLCPSGYYCDQPGLSAPAGQCLAGFYCPTGSTSGSSILCPKGHYCPAGIAAPQDCSKSMIGESECSSGTTCTFGQYYRYGACYSCPSGTFQPTLPYRRDDQICQPCSAGQYCQYSGLRRPTGHCQTPGYYCPLRSRSETSTICPINHFCPATTEEGRPVSCPLGTNSTAGAVSIFDCKPVPKCLGGGMYLNGSLCTSCPIGTYLPESSIDHESCLPCEAGKYCQTRNLKKPTGSCLARYYCPSGSTHPNSEVCPKDHYCPEGSGTPTRCPRRAVSNVGSSKLQDCRGVSCAPGNYSDGFLCKPCPSGTYQPLWTEGEGIEACRLCDEGKYCDGIGLTAPTGVCALGYICLIGSTESTPQLCPKNHYCPPNGYTIVPCPPETTSKPGSTFIDECLPSKFNCSAGYYGYQNACRQCPMGMYKGSSGNGQCTICPAGKHCSGQGLTAVSGICHDGYYCPAGSTNGTAVLCPENHYCPSGQGSPTPCRAGYRSYPGSTRSTNCQSQNYPVPLLCPTGHYLHKDGNKCEKCPPGSFNPVKSRSLKEVCKACPAGRYCEGAGCSTWTGACSAGYICPPGSSHPQAIICPGDYFCPAGSKQASPCPDGEFSHPGASRCSPRVKTVMYG